MPEDPFAACPPLAWVVQLDGNQTEEVHTVELLPDGDIVVAGTCSSSPRIGLGAGQRLRPSQNFRDGFVARLAPDGIARWWRTVGSSGMDELPAMAVVEGSIWVMGSSELGGEGAPSRAGVAVDGEPVGPPPADESRNQFYALELGLDGAPGRLRSVELQNGSGQSYLGGATTDPYGNVYLSGESGKPGVLWVGDLTDGGNPYSSVFLASWDAEGRPRWLTTLGAEDTLAEPIQGLTWTEGKVQWPVQLRTGSRRAVARSSGGASRTLAFGEMQGGILAVDAETGEVLPLRFHTDTNWLQRLDVQPTGDRLAVLQMNADTRAWTDAEGTPRQLTGLGAPLARIDADGAILDLQATDFGLRDARGAALTADGMAAVGISEPILPLAPGTPREFQVPGDSVGLRDAVALTTGRNGTLQCVAWIHGPESADALDIVPLPVGGMVVVGKFQGTVTISTPAGDQATLTALGDEDGYIARFAAP